MSPHHFQTAHKSCLKTNRSKQNFKSHQLQLLLRNLPKKAKSEANNKINSKTKHFTIIRSHKLKVENNTMQTFTVL